MAKTKPKTKRKAAKAKAKAKPQTKTNNARAAGGLPPALEKRLRTLAKQMDTTMAALTLQALSEFAKTWEDHFRNVKALQDDDRIQLAVKPE